MGKLKVQIGYDVLSWVVDKYIYKDCSSLVTEGLFKYLQRNDVNLDLELILESMKIYNNWDKEDIKNFYLLYHGNIDDVNKFDFQQQNKGYDIIQVRELTLVFKIA